MRKIALALATGAFASLSFVGSVAAQERCLRDTQSELTACFRERFNAADEDLNRAYSWLLEATDNQPDEVENLRAAQRAWVGFRDAECHFRGMSARGGSMEPMLINICLLELTENRTTQLVGILGEIRAR